eukprot:2770872-Rhodomonas_salina.1
MQQFAVIGRTPPAVSCSCEALSGCEAFKRRENTCGVLGLLKETWLGTIMNRIAVWDGRKPSISRRQRGGAFGGGVKREGNLDRGAVVQGQGHTDVTGKGGVRDREGQRGTARGRGVKMMVDARWLLQR